MSGATARKAPKPNHAGQEPDVAASPSLRVVANNAAPVNTGKVQGGAPPFQPGQSGNPRGRPKGSRNKLGEDFLAAIQSDFAIHGIATIAKVREERPHEYLKVVAGLLPKELNVKTSPLEDLSDDELEASIQVLLKMAQAGVPDVGASRDDETKP